MSEERPAGEDSAEEDPAEPVRAEPGSAEPDLAGIDPAETDPAEEVTPIGKWTVFLLCAAVTVVLVALVCFAISLPACEHPPNSWAPCIGP
ncbi:hypothetical protein GCM10010977_20860 [Citricoccus zhacaiensis]|uniref:Uncharacterized protein n=1 Tax=Citricoccus zhacaiensis TaxID=489142 RepID=A0ABQ2M2A2_9MICC|nr:hypothetical protein [Citricoccus zhacaiensis]GGO46274.1 hypothetical protein GCM10010977_20860 [Citricoccus zhacaiensis]